MMSSAEVADRRKRDIARLPSISVYKEKKENHHVERQMSITDAEPRTSKREEWLPGGSGGGGDVRMHNLLI